MNYGITQPEYSNKVVQFRDEYVHAALTQIFYFPLPLLSNSRTTISMDPIRLDGDLNALERWETRVPVTFYHWKSIFSCFNITSYHWTIHENHSTTHNYIEILFGSCEFKNHNKKHSLYAPCVTETSMVNRQEQKMNKNLLPKHVPECIRQMKKISVFFVYRRLWNVWAWAD